MRDSIHNVILKLLAVLLGLWGLVRMIDGFDRTGAFSKMGAILCGILVIATAVGFFRMRGWAFLLASAGLLLSFFVNLVDLILAVDAGQGVKGRAFWFVITIVLIGYIGRWSIERRFRPHLDAAGQH